MMIVHGKLLPASLSFERLFKSLSTLHRFIFGSSSSVVHDEDE